MRSTRRATTLAALLLAGCDPFTRPNPLSPTDVAGDYALVGFSGLAVGEDPGQVTGVVRLSALGGVERRLTARAADGSTTVHIIVGSYTLRGDRLELTLFEARYAWRPPSTLDRGVLTLRYPSPADGPDIVERYERR